MPALKTLVLSCGVAVLLSATGASAQRPASMNYAVVPASLLEGHASDQMVSQGGWSRAVSENRPLLIPVRAEAPVVIRREAVSPPLRCAVPDAENVRVMAPSLDIRASAAPDAPIVARVTKHRHLEVLQGIAKLVGERARRRACAQACRGYGDVLLRQEDPLEWARDKMAAAACMAENVIWWNVALPDGRSGWVSAKDLR